MASRLVEWTIIACFPAGIFLLVGLLEIPSFLDPCHAWGDGSAAPTQTMLTGTCVGQTSTHETKAQAATRLLFYQGTTLVGLVVALVGAAREKRVLVGIGAGMLAAISLPLMGDYRFIFPLGSALLLGLGLWLNRPASPRALGGP